MKKDIHNNNSNIEDLDIYQSYLSSKYLSIKHSSYFQVYEEVLTKYKNKRITFVEVGVLNGGSLFMWRNYFGLEARIIGIDFNPIAKKWEEDGFEIYIGNQADPNFWDKFFLAVGDVDVILDDGGHTNEQQIVTTHKSIPHIRDGGMLLVEDTHTSYFGDFGNPSKYSFINYCKKLLDSINSRFPAVNVSNNILNKYVYSLAFYESIVCFSINREKCFVSKSTSNEGISFNAEDFRHYGSGLGTIAKFRASGSKRLIFLKKIVLFKFLAQKLLGALFFVTNKFKSIRLKKYFN